MVSWATLRQSSFRCDVNIVVIEMEMAACLVPHMLSNLTGSFVTIWTFQFQISTWCTCELKQPKSLQRVSVFSVSKCVLVLDDQSYIAVRQTILQSLVSRIEQTNSLVPVWFVSTPSAARMYWWQYGCKRQMIITSTFWYTKHEIWVFTAMRKRI